MFKEGLEGNSDFIDVIPPRFFFPQDFIFHFQKNRLPRWVRSNKYIRKCHGNLVHFEPVHFLQCFFSYCYFLKHTFIFWNIDGTTGVNSFVKWISNIIVKWSGKSRKQVQDAYCSTDRHPHSLKGKETQQIHFLFESNHSAKKRTRDNNSKVSCPERTTNSQGKEEEKTSNKRLLERHREQCGSAKHILCRV